MKKILLLLMLFSMTILLFAQEEEVTVIQAKRNIRPKILLGLGFDVLLGSDATRQKVQKRDDSTFTETSESTNESTYDAAIMGSIYFLIGARILGNLDLYSTMGVNIAVITHNLDVRNVSDYIIYNRFDFNIDANARYTFLIGSFGGPYIGAGLGSAINITEYIDWYKYNKNEFRHEVTTLTNNNDEIKVHFYTNSELGFLFRIQKNEAFTVGYTMRYYFSSIFNENGEKTLKKKNSETTKVNFGDNQVLHGIKLEFSSSF